MHAVPPYYMHGAAPKMQSYPGADGVHDHADDHADPTDDGVLLMVQFVLTDAKTVSRVTAGLSRAAQEFVEEVYTDNDTDDDMVLSSSSDSDSE